MKYHHLPSFTIMIIIISSQIIPDVNLTCKLCEGYVEKQSHLIILRASEVQPRCMGWKLHGESDGNPQLFWKATLICKVHLVFRCYGKNYLQVSMLWSVTLVKMGRTTFKISKSCSMCSEWILLPCNSWELEAFNVEHCNNSWFWILRQLSWICVHCCVSCTTICGNIKSCLSQFSKCPMSVLCAIPFWIIGV